VVKHISDEIMVMYLGQMVEMSPVRDIFEHPLHPYTKGLLSAIPVPSLSYKKERIIMQGEITSPVDPKPGCRFAARCSYAGERCACEQPVTEEILPGHYVACHQARQINGL
jgi:peptide/nickel transport system ATP-binding protein